MQCKVYIDGVVQGVGFRPFVYRVAKKHGLGGYVKNLGDAGVEIVVEGKKDSINKFLIDLEEKKPPISRIDRVKKKYINSSQFTDFKILKSSKRGKMEGVSVIPPDIGVCDDCVSEMFDERDERYMYPFINCTNCGPRFSIFWDLPYDRPLTSMKEFLMCDFCEEEYTNPMNRRYHAQPICCWGCGPTYSLYQEKTEVEKGVKAVKAAAKFLDSSKIVAIKGIGGFHIACSTENDEVVLRLRKNLKRPEQPFAIISKDKDSVGEFAELSKEEEELLESWRRPIVILKKKKDFFLSKYLAPNLSTIGVMLPYTPLHHLLFHYSKSKSFVMTSANKPSYPMVVENEAAFQELNFVDYYLIHNLEIVNRIDDSVIKFIKKKPVFVRRSRGYVPQYLEANHEKNVLALGAELTNTFCITKNRKAIPSQYIGNTYNFDCLEFQKKAISHFKKVLKIKDFDYVFCDYHPEYNTTKLALEFENVFKVQHHFAHGFSLGEDLVVIACDGIGYGVDSKIWGGEILYVGDEFARLGHLENQVLAGGDVSTHYPVRISLAILKKVFKNPIEEMERYEKYFRYGKEEMRIVLEQIKKKVNVTETSSCGRILDSASSILEICNFRSYEGEPAMKLEAIASGKEIELPLEIFEVNELKSIAPYVEYKKKIKGKRGRLQILKTTPIVREIFERYRKGERKKILAKSILACIAKGLAQIAIEGAREYETKRIGFSGGCAYNSVMTEVIKREVEREGFEFLQQQNVPPGDGGISYGQVKFAKFLG